MADDDEPPPADAFGGERRGSLPPEEVDEDDELNPANYEHLDAMNSEFIYFSTTLKAIAPTLSSVDDRARIVPWIKKLFGPEYQAMFFRKKRNKYLLHLCLKILKDEIDGIFKNAPPCGAIPNVENLEPEPRAPAKWETDTTWERLIEDMSPEQSTMGCSIHEENCNEKQEQEQKHVLPSALLDLEFRYFLYLARPYAALLLIAEDKAKVASWIQTLATIRTTACIGMKGIRNDYMQNLLGYLIDLRATGPFQDYPEKGVALPPLQDAAKQYALRHPFTDPYSKDAADFLVGQPIPENGAMCYVAVSGDLTETNLVTTKPEESY